VRRFSDLFEQIDSTTSTRQKLDHLRRYFAEANAADAAWAVYFLSGHRLKRIVGPARLRQWLVEASGLPEWLVTESYAAVGDLAETIALLTSGPHHGAAAEADLALHRWIEERILPLAKQSSEEQKRQVTRWWLSLRPGDCLIVNKLMTGALRLGVSRALLARALAELTGLPRELMLQRLAGDWQATADSYAALIDARVTARDASRPYPFYLASALNTEPEQLGPVEDFLAEWKWDGIRCQVIRRGDEVELWSRGEDRMTGRFPEIEDAARALPDGTVLDGEIIVWHDDGPAAFAELQRRIGRKRLTAALLGELPVRFIVYDLLELDGIDLRARPLRERRTALERMTESLPRTISASPTVAATCWQELAELRLESRARRVEGLMLKHLDSRYGVGRQRGAWWKWKIDPYTFDAVLLYAHPGHGRRSNLYTDYTFAVWRGDELVPITKAYSGLDQGEIERLDRWIRRHTVERFGPTRAVAPELVFELAFEGISRSSRHKSGLALRFPRILRWREDKGPEEADGIPTLLRLMEAPR
jgi:DNA ligase-1